MLAGKKWARYIKSKQWKKDGDFLNFSKEKKKKNTIQVRKTTPLWAIMERMFLWPTIGFNYCDLSDLLQFSTKILWRECYKITLKSIFKSKWGLWVQDTERQITNVIIC